MVGGAAALTRRISRFTAHHKRRTGEMMVLEQCLEKVDGHGKRKHGESGPPQPGTHEPEEPSPVGESVHAEQVAAPLTVPKITSVHIKPGRCIVMPSAA